MTSLSVDAVINEVCDGRFEIVIEPYRLEDPWVWGYSLGGDGREVVYGRGQSWCSSWAGSGRSLATADSWLQAAKGKPATMNPSNRYPGSGPNLRAGALWFA